METFRIVTSGTGLSVTIEGSCNFSRERIQSTCTSVYTDSRGVRLMTEAVTRYARVEDVVDEVAVVPPLMKYTNITSTTSGTALQTTTNTTDVMYDGLMRPASMSSVSRPSGQIGTTRYSSWDLAGRPTAATVINGTQTSTQVFSYNDATRTQTITTPNGPPCTQTFDENGNPTAGACAGSTTTTTILSTQQICR